MYITGITLPTEFPWSDFLSDHPSEELNISEYSTAYVRTFVELSGFFNRRKRKNANLQGNLWAGMNFIRLAPHSENEENPEIKQSFQSLMPYNKF